MGTRNYHSSYSKQQPEKIRGIILEIRNVLETKQPRNLHSQSTTDSLAILSLSLEHLERESIVCARSVEPDTDTSAAATASVDDA